MAKKKNNNTILLIAGAAGLFLLMKNKSKASSDNNTDNSTDTNTPASPSTLTFSSPTDFVNQTWKLAAYTEANSNIPAESMIIISAIETGWGKSELCMKYNNYFGIHATPDWTGKTVAGDGGTMRVYDTPQDSFDDFADFIKTNSRYAPSVSDTDPMQFITDIQHEGYTTNDTTTQDKYIATAQSIYNSMLPQFTSLRGGS